MRFNGPACHVGGTRGRFLLGPRLPIEPRPFMAAFIHLHLSVYLSALNFSLSNSPQGFAEILPDREGLCYHQSARLISRFICKLLSLKGHSFLAAALPNLS